MCFKLTTDDAAADSDTARKGRDELMRFYALNLKAGQKSAAGVNLLYALCAITWLSIASATSGSYNPSPVDVWAGGYGYAAIEGSATGQSATWVDVGNPIKCSGKLTRIRTRLYKISSYPTVFKFKLFSGSPGNLTLQRSFSVTPHIQADLAGVSDGHRFEYDTSATYGSTTFDLAALNIQVYNGWYIGIYGDNDSVAYVFNTNEGGVIHAMYGDNTPTGSWAIPYPMELEAEVQTNKYILFDDTNSSSGWHGGDPNIRLPFYKNEAQYIILQDVNVPANSFTRVNFIYNNSSGARTTLFSMDVNFVNSINRVQIGNTSTSLASQEAATKLTFSIWLDPNTDKYDVMIVNLQRGQGPESILDIKHISLSRRQTISAGIDLAAYPIRQISLEGGGKIGRIVVCRKPVLAVGDSFVGTYTSYYVGAALRNVGDKLDDPGIIFSQQRYVINGGISGNCVLRNSTHLMTAIKDRWNKADVNEDMCAYRDVVVVFVNGPGLNDVAINDAGSGINGTSSDSDIRALATRIGSTVANMAGEAQYNFDALGGKNDVILCEMIPYLANTDAEYINENRAIQYINSYLRKTALTLNVPIALVGNLDPSYISADGTHPTDAGSIFIAQQIAGAYESWPSTGPGGGCINQPENDLNGDCKVDFQDFVIFTSEWLNCGFADPNACWQ